jgi:hypothetical protein
LQETLALRYAHVRALGRAFLSCIPLWYLFPC